MMVLVLVKAIPLAKNINIPDENTNVVYELLIRASHASSP